MDRTKTGALIAAARKEQNMTQKELAAALHVSDRAVSKWERGAGFPDISLLEPLADTLGLGVLDLLRGERGTVPEPEPTIRQALAFLARQAKERTRRKWSQVLGGTCALLMAGFVLFAILDRAGVFLQEISLEVPATVYSAEGVSAGETTVAIDGSVKILGDRSFEGQFAIHEVETTCREGVHANIRWDAMWTDAQDILFYRELGLDLASIRTILDDPAFDRQAALQSHLAELEARRARLDDLILTVQRTINDIKGGTKMTDQEKFEAFKRHVVEANEAAFGREIRQKYGDAEADLANACVLALTHDPLLGGHIRRNLFNERLTIEATLPWVRESSVISDTDLAFLQLHLERHYGLKAERCLPGAAPRRWKKRPPSLPQAGHPRPASALMIPTIRPSLTWTW